ncbi:metallophosphoesterase [uncultured Methanoregula sp.]|uniref:metallophosphoesterase family protein n=1 Tax=uncultured Methanoregula sp. TaxID=1005933 RepID=UPI002AAA7084|nr:metallophosphoesterase [uncultured Methanoregula sp.]
MHTNKVTSYILVICLVLTGFSFLAGCTRTGSDTTIVKIDSGNVSGPAASTGSRTWKFVVFGDSPDPAENTTTGVSPQLSLIANAVAAERPDMALYIGDLVSGWALTNASPMQNNYTGQFGNWEEAVSPIYNYTTGSGIPLYIIRGNHEDGPDKTDAALLDAYRATVASGMPVNGPPGEEKLTYSFAHKGAKFILIDDYIAHNGKKETVNQSWVNGQLKEDTRSFTFVVGHSPAYLVDNDTEDIPYSLPTRPTERDTFWNSMVNNNVSAYFCGHAHLYVRAGSQGLTQIVSGNGGAPMQGFDPALANPALTLEYPKESIAQNDQKVGYLVITVHEDSRTFEGVQQLYNTTTRSWETGDTFTLRAR